MKKMLVSLMLVGVAVALGAERGPVMKGTNEQGRVFAVQGKGTLTLQVKTNGGPAVQGIKTNGTNRTEAVKGEVKK